jgi:signal transduction histidine kinase
MRSRLRRWLRSATGDGRGRRALYCLLSVPLGAMYAALIAGLVASAVLAVQGVGLLTALVLLTTARGLGGLERHLARRLLGLRIAPDRQLRRTAEPRVRRLLLVVVSSSTWRTMGWLAARVLLGAGVLATLVSGLAGVVALVLEAPWSRWTALPLTAVALLVLVLVLAALDLQVRLAAVIAPRLLGLAPEEELAVLHRTSQRLAHRNRLARDLHDTIGHSLTASLLQAAAARRTLVPHPGEPERPVDTSFARQALEHIETNTRAALAELDRALAVLRDDGTPAEGQAHEPVLEGPGLGDLDGLLTGLRDGGLPVHLDVDRDVVAHLPRATSRLGYRIVQEATTNVLRHAGCTPTTVEVGRDGDQLRVRVRNAVPQGRASRPGPGGGTGLRGLRERATAAGGRLDTGPVEGGGFQLTATLPLVGAP